MPKKTVQQTAPYFILCLSGFAGLGYEMVWTRMLSVGLGHEIIAVLAVVGAFFCGMALGAWALDGVVSRSLRPGTWYAVVELAIGIWSLILIFLIPSLNRFAGILTGVTPSELRHWSVAFVLPFFLLLPATLAMGATLPAMERLFSRLRQDGWSVGGLYAANTFGAVAGTLLTTFIIAPAIGFRATAGLLAIVNVICATGMVLGPARNETERPPVATGTSNMPGSRQIMGTLFVTGFLGIGYEILVVRVASQVLENTIYSFACLLSVYLLGTAAGAALYQAVVTRRKFQPVLTNLLAGLAFSCLIGVAVLTVSEQIFLSLRNLMGGGIIGAIAGEVGLAGSVFFLPTLIMGALFSHLTQAARRPSGGVGKALAINTLGASIAPLVFGVFLLPAIGAKLCLVAASLGYLLLIPSRRWKRWLPAAMPLGLSVVILLNPVGLDFTTVMPGGRVVKHIEGVMAAVSVIEDSRNEYYLKVNNKFVMGGTASRFSDWRQGHIPLLLHPHPETALFLGLGTGATFAASADYPQLSAQGVELVPEVIRVLPYFKKSTGSLADNVRLKIHIADARRFLNTCHESFDVIVADLFHPARDGAGFLYTVEHFKAIRSLLNPGGIFCQWLPLYQMDLDVFRTIVWTFMHVFPSGRAFLATYSLQTPIIGLIAGGDCTLYPSDYMEKRVTSKQLYRRLAALRLSNTYTLFGTFIAGPFDLINFAGKGPLNTDDRPIVIFKAPNYVYAGNEPAYVRLFALLDDLNPDPDQILQAASTVDERVTHARLRAYWTARNNFLHAGVGVRQTANVEQMLRQVREPLLAIVDESPDFEAAYDPLLFMARQLYRINPDAAMHLLIQLEAANPIRQDAGRLKEYLDGIPP
jgi:spermidine synthase